MFATSNPFARLIGPLQKTDRRDWESCSYGPEDGHKLEWCLDDCGREGAVERKGRHPLLRNGLQSYGVYAELGIMAKGVRAAVLCNPRFTNRIPYRSLDGSVM